MFKEFIEKLYWWIPTKKDQINYRKDELDRINREYMPVLQELQDVQKRMNLLENQLKYSLSQTQMPIYMDLKVLGNKAVFLKGKLDYFNEAQKEIINLFSEEKEK